MKISYLIPILFLSVISCKNDFKESNVKSDNDLRFITKIELKEKDGKIEINSGGKTIYFQENELPLKTVMVVPTSAIAYMEELNLIEKITGISQPDFIFNPKIHELINKNKISTIGSFDEIFLEKILTNKPDIFISTSSPTLAKFHEQLEKENIKVIYIDEYEELNPLARAEYVKIFGILFGKKKEANELFRQIEKNYTDIKTLAEKKKAENPTIFANQIYGDIWYMPGGKSFQAKLIEDAGGNYLWKSDDGTGTLNLSFESVFEKANDADIWINAGDFPDKATLLASYKNYEWFSTFKNGNIYNWNQRITAKGANDYFETGTARPDLVLKDLAAIFHPELFPNYELMFYKMLK
ncbi:ABC transporter substrate-binding protein [Moheibacter sediminis]|uniref:Iron complex transport system substrate-binding protein n=1 Tax=Moheibacter sediminis TaxID=1434700 RepID=A0A1W1YLI0_9FLAO|nr:ABC transporter substrate-binding protein [Moheibacter sediminis]SMC37004.1 iron complex transport system substrate-binding protein [Moheibacter sediminis]